MKRIRRTNSALVWSAPAGGLLGAAIVASHVVNWWIEDGQTRHYSTSFAPIALAFNHFIIAFIIYPLAGSMLAVGLVWAFQRKH